MRGRGSDLEQKARGLVPGVDRKRRLCDTVLALEHQEMTRIDRRSQYLDGDFMGRRIRRIIDIDELCHLTGDAESIETDG